MTVRKKKTTKKRTSTSLPSANGIPEGFQTVGGSYSPSWKYEDVGDSVTGEITSATKEVTLNKGTKKEHTCRVVDLTQDDGDTVTIWESATLTGLFDEIDDNGPGGVYYIRYDGIGKKKPGLNPPKLFTVAKAA